MRKGGNNFSRLSNALQANAFYSFDFLMCDISDNRRVACVTPLHCQKCIVRAFHNIKCAVRFAPNLNVNFTVAVIIVLRRQVGFRRAKTSSLQLSVRAFQNTPIQSSAAFANGGKVGFAVTIIIAVRGQIRSQTELNTVKANVLLLRVCKVSSTKIFG